MRRVRRRFSAVVLGALVLVGTACAGKDDPTRPKVEAGVQYAPGLQLDVYRPVRGLAPLPAIVLLHGDDFADGSRADMSDLADSLASRGYVAVTIDYHLTPGSWLPATTLTDPGLAAAAARARADAAAAVDWLRANADHYRVDPDRIAVGGFSAGGIAAIELATHAPPSVWAVVALAAAAVDQAALTRPHPPMLMVRGDADNVVPATLVDQTCQKAAVSGECQVKGLGVFGHDLLTSVRYQDVEGAIGGFLDHLGGK
jgi:dienelactone hydrolase